ncbi:hypothetical protein KIW84_042287 [Lathyrus oleraceus]|uniref:CCAAT-binding factor domain-containing protein n=1 Tax=Pisum sativum TaxID=3888 RepID=A0A9D4XC16_PEA|nr:hypothetical protein KIW84_042287 [Pisum sativum]
MRTNLDALQDFNVHLYNLLLEYRPGRDQEEVLAEALKITLFYGGLGHSKAPFLKNIKCKNLLENDTGGGSVSGTILKYLPYATDPILSGALASVLWELSLLSKHYHPAISTMATVLSSMSTEQNQLFLSKSSPQLAFRDMSVDQELCFEKVAV